MKKSLILLIFSFFLLGVINLASAINCNSCDSCSLNSVSNEVVYVTNNITFTPSGYCEGPPECEGKPEPECNPPCMWITNSLCIRIYQSSNITFDCQNNSIIGANSGDVGLMLDYENHNVTVKNCHITNFGWADLEISNSYNNIVDNVILENSENVLYVLSSSTNYSWGNIIKNSIIKGQIKAEDSPYNWIYNNIINATNYLSGWSFPKFNISATSGTNIIGGNMLGGNYWAKPDGTGYSQTCANNNNDAFCDNPFQITSGIYDYLPLNETGIPPDTIPPNITWNQPSINNSYTNNETWVYWNVTISETPSTCLLNINNSQNYTMSISGEYCYYNLTGLTNQTTYCGRVYANDTFGNLNLSDIMCVTINLTEADTIPPNIIIHSPENITYNQLQVYLNVSADETIDSWWYSLNNGSNITFIPKITITVFEGNNHIIVYGNDTSGNIGFAETFFYVLLPTKPYNFMKTLMGQALLITLGAGVIFLIMSLFIFEKMPLTIENIILIMVLLIVALGLITALV